MNMRTRHFFLEILLALLLVATGCRQAREPISRPAVTTTPTEQTTLTPQIRRIDRAVVLVANSLTTLDPYLMVSITPDDSIAAHLWDTLVWLNDDLELEPRLAESWRLLNDLTWELTLRQDVTFHNGEPFDAQAVKFSLERTALLPNSLETFASDVAFENVEVIDDYTVRIHTARPAVSMIYALSSVEIVPPVYYAQIPLDDLSHSPVGSGPYRLTSWEPGDRVVLEANSDYWQGAPAIQTLVFQTEPDLEERLATAGSDGAYVIADIPPDWTQSADSERARLVAVESTRRLFVGLRAEASPPLTDKRVRQALNYAVDVQGLIDEFHAGYGQRYGSWVNPPHADPSLSPWPYDPEKAKDLLFQAGYAGGFEITMDTPVGRYYRDREIAEAIAAQLADVGVEVTVQPQEWSTYLRERLAPKETAPLFLLSLISRGDGMEDTRNLAYDFPFNPTLWRNEEFETLLDRADQTFNETLRLNLLRQAQAIAYEEAPWIWLWRPYLFYDVSEELSWWHPRADGLIYLYTQSG